MPGPFTIAASAGTNNLIRDRAAALIASGADALALLITEQEKNAQFDYLKDQA